MSPWWLPLVLLQGVAEQACGPEEAACAPAAGLQGAALLQRAARKGTVPGVPPEEPRVGVLFGYDREPEPGSFGAVSLRLARRWAELQNYSLFLEPRFGRLTARSGAPVWDKIEALRSHLSRVDILFWLDLDVFVLDPSRRVQDLLRTERGGCTHAARAEHDARLAAKADELFLWAATAAQAHLDSGTYRHGPPAYKLNLCAGAFALRNHPMSFRFLEEVWAQKHWPGWPAEQGAMWRVLLGNGDMLERTCILHEDDFVYESLESPERALLAQGRGSFAIHATGFKGPTAEAKRAALARAACDKVFADVGGCPEFNETKD